MNLGSLIWLRCQASSGAGENKVLLQAPKIGFILDNMKHLQMPEACRLHLERLEGDRQPWDTTHDVFLLFLSFDLPRCQLRGTHGTGRG